LIIEGKKSTLSIRTNEQFCSCLLIARSVALAVPTAIYPSYGFDQLRTKVGQRWADLIENISRLPVTDPHAMALNLTLRRVHRAGNHKDGASCHDPLCAACGAEIASGYRGSEQDLIELYYRSYEEIKSTLKLMSSRRSRRAVQAA
jgi:hypothetical protein